MNRIFFLICIMTLSLLHNPDTMHAMEIELVELEETDSDESTETEPFTIINISGYGSIDSSSVKKNVEITLPMLLSYLPIEIITNKIIPILISIEKFMLYTDPDICRKNLDDEFIKKFGALSISTENPTAVKSVDLGGVQVVVQTNIKQLALLTDTEKRLIFNNIFKFIEIPIFNNASARAIFISILDRCNEDFSAMSKEEIEAQSLEELIETCKKTFCYKTMRERAGIILFHNGFPIIGLGFVLITIGIFITILITILFPEQEKYLFLVGPAVIVSGIASVSVQVVMSGKKCLADWKEHCCCKGESFF